jgi:hypothetical protein
LAEHDSMRKEAQSLDVDHFHKMIRTTQSSQILEARKSSTFQRSA